MILKEAVTELIQCWQEIAQHRLEAERATQSHSAYVDAREYTLQADRRVEDLQGLLEDMNKSTEESTSTHDDFHSFDL